jgi:hypothetical protein
MSEHKLPSGLHKNNVGKVVSVQVFRRNGEDTIDTETLEKHVGMLESYSHDRHAIHIKIRGLTLITAARAKHLVEVYI